MTNLGRRRRTVAMVCFGRPGFTCGPISKKAVIPCKFNFPTATQRDEISYYCYQIWQLNSKKKANIDLDGRNELQ